MPFEEAEVLATFNRSFGDRKEELRLERGSYEGKPTYTLRLYWQGGDGIWRWGQQKPTQSGKCWERLNLKARELRDLGAALMLAADDMARAPAPAKRAPAEREPESDDIPF
jgi:hypothetical protein